MPLPKNKKNDQYRIMARRIKVAKLYVEGATQCEIAHEVGVSQNAITKDLQAIRQEWLASAQSSYDERKAQELAKIDNLERLAIKAWTKSCNDAEIDVRKVERALRSVNDSARVEGGKRGGSGKVLNVEMKMLPIKKTHHKTVKGQTGNPAFLEIIKACIELRAKICGLFTDVTVNSTNISVAFSWDKLLNAPGEWPDEVEDAIVAGIPDALPAPVEVEVPANDNG